MKPIDTKSITLFSRLAAGMALIALGIILLFSVLQTSGSVGYFESNLYGSEWLNYATGGFEQIDDFPVWGWHESNLESGYVLSRYSRFVLIPTQLIVGIILLLAGLRLFPKDAQ